MTTVTTQAENSPLVLHLHPIINLTDEQFFEFCQINRDLHIERTATGELLIMPPTGSETGNRNFKLIQQLANWTDVDGTGIGFDSSTGFKLPNGAERSPDAAWVKLERWNTLTPEQQKKFAPNRKNLLPSVLNLWWSCVLLLIVWNRSKLRCRSILTMVRC